MDVLLGHIYNNNVRDEGDGELMGCIVGEVIINFKNID